MNGRFYVYLWLDPRTTPMTPRYVGKGIDGRAWTWNRKKDKNPKLHEFVVDLWFEGRRPWVEILGLFDTEDESFAAEIAYVQKYGRLDEGRGPLLNCSSGGKGNSSMRAPPHTEARRAASSERMKRLNADPQHQAKAQHKKRTDPETKVAMSARMRELNARPDFHSEERRKAAADRLISLNKTREYSPEERAARSARTTAMNEARKAKRE